MKKYQSKIKDILVGSKNSKLFIRERIDNLCFNLLKKCHKC